MGSINAQPRGSFAHPMHHDQITGKGLEEDNMMDDLEDMLAEGNVGGPKGVKPRANAPKT